MKMRSVRLVIVIAITAICFILISGCNNGDNGGERSAEIRGSVTQVVEAIRRTETPPSTFAQLRELLALVRTAHAQSSNAAGIIVNVQLNGVTLDTDETDEEGNFVLGVDEGPLVLTFTTDTFSVILNLVVVSNSVVTLEVSLHPTEETEVVIESLSTVQTAPEGLVDCEHGTLTLAAEQINGEQAAIEIDGDGEVCIRTQSNCRMTTEEGMTADIIMTHCQECIRAESESEIRLITAGSIICENAREDGVRAESGSEIELIAGHRIEDDNTATEVATVGATIDISAAQDGVRTEGSSHAILLVEGSTSDDPIPSISVSGGSMGIRTEGESTADLSVTDEIEEPIGSIFVEGGDIGIRAEGATEVTLSAEICTIEGANEATRMEGEAIIDGMCLPALEL